MLGVSDVNSDCVESAENSPTSPANTPELAGNMEEMRKVSEGELDAIERPVVLFSHTNELEIPDLTEAKTNPLENNQDNGTIPPVKTQLYPPQSPPEDTLVASAEPLTCPRVESGDAALQAREGGLPGVRLLGADYMLYVVYQDGVHQNPGDHLDGGIAEYSKWQAWWKNLYICRPNATTHLLQKLGRYLLESCP